MTIESLLALLKNEVSEVSRVQPSNGAAPRRYLIKPEEVSQVSGNAAVSKPETPNTSGNQRGVSARSASTLACTPDTRATLQPAFTGANEQALRLAGADDFAEALGEPYSGDHLAEVYSGKLDPDQRSYHWLVLLPPQEFEDHFPEPVSRFELAKKYPPRAVLIPFVTVADMASLWSPLSK